MNEDFTDDSILPRKGSVMYSFMKETKSNQKKTANKFKRLNKFLVVPFYRIYILPIFQIGRIIALVYTKGRKSGKRRITPLEFRRYDNKILLFSARGKYSDWYNNIIENPGDLKIRIGFRMYKPTPVKSSEQEKFKILKWYIGKFPKSAKELFGYKKEIDIISDELIKPVAEFLEILQLTI